MQFEMKTLIVVCLFGLSLVSLGSAGVCYTDWMARDYRGTISRTKTGWTCQKWTAQSPNRHGNTPENRPYAGLGDHNYCRNPDDTPGGAWCYVDNDWYDPMIPRWQFCRIGSPQPSCPGSLPQIDPECYTDETGSDYRGTVSKTKDGWKCQKWTAQSPQEHDRTPENYEDAGLGWHNYCRNPDEAAEAWCYIDSTDPSAGRWGYCNVGSPKPTCHGTG